MKKIIIDTDIGSDIDDALALAFAVRSGAFNILGVTTVSGDTEKRKEVAEKLLETLGHSGIPVLAGLGDAQNVGGEAVDFIVNTVAASDQNEITILTIGPLMNIAACIRKAPEVMKKVRLVIMGGMVSKAFAEWNVAADAESAGIVFESDAAKVMIGLDVTLKCELPAEKLNAIVRGGGEWNRYLDYLTRIWKRDFLAPILRSWHMDVSGEDYDCASGMHDPMAAAYLIKPEWFQTRKALILVETGEGHAKGLTLESVNVFRNNHPNGYNCDVAFDVNADAFLSYFNQIMGV